MSASRPRAAVSMTVMYCRCCWVNSVSSANAAVFRMAFIVVRISWLIVARNALLARLAASAASLTFASSASWRLRAVMSATTVMPRMKRPSGPRMADAATSPQRSSPFFRRKKSVLASYSAGRSDFLMVLGSERELQMHELELASHLAAYEQRIAELEHAVGAELGLAQAAELGLAQAAELGLAQAAEAGHVESH